MGHHETEASAPQPGNQAKRGTTMNGLSLPWLAVLLAAWTLLPAACGEGIVDLPTTPPAPFPTAGGVVGPDSQPAPSPTAAPKPARASPTPVAATASQESTDARPLAPVKLEPAFPGLEFDRMVLLTYPDDGSGRLFLALQPGRIVVFENEPGVESAETFLDIRERVNDSGNEEGLLGLAFDPAFAENGYFYVNYTASGPRRTVVSRFSVDARNPDRADADSEVVFLEVAQPYQNHNGGHVAFGPDGMLYVGLGDGGWRGDPRGNGQDLSTLLGSILRIDVSALDETGGYAAPPDNPFADDATARPEIWAYGLRNPWRFSFDRETGDLWAADVGQNRYEEIDLVRPGRNYGWNVMEGAHCYRQEGCDTRGLEFPVAEYGRDGGCSVTGGYVYRERRLPTLHGAYLYADFCSGKIWALRHDGVSVTEQMLIADTGLSISSFGEDASGEVYVLTFDGVVYRFGD